MGKRYSFIIPTIKATTLVDECISSLKKYEPDTSKYEIIVVDDGSDTVIQDWLREYCNKNDIKLCAKRENRGFSHSINLGMTNATGDIMILLNNDVVFIQPFLGEIENAFNHHPEIGVVGGKLLYPDMRVQHAGVIRYPRTNSFLHINKFYSRDATAVNVSKYFLSVTGALLALKREVYQKVGDFNDKYFIACEDCEYCLRVWKAGFRVFYSHKIEAIHVEGMTRGNDDKSKLKKGPEWFLKERETFAKFYADLGSFKVNEIEVGVVRLNNDLSKNGDIKLGENSDKPKLEIGCGNNPQPGYLHLDVRKLPHVEYVCDFANDRLPFNDKELDEVLGNHVIEHISWRKLPFVLNEWYRVLAPGGKLFLRTPDLEFICKTYLDGRVTPEWPEDEKYIKDNLSPQVTPAWWANIKLFAGQDYPSNFHYLCFDFKMMKDLLEKFGFEKVNRVQIAPVYSPGEIQVEAYKPQSQVNNISRSQTKVLVKRKGALGDVLLTTPIVRRLRDEMGSDTVIDFATDCGAVYTNNKFINSVFPGSKSTQGYDRIFDLDLVYERTPKMHIIDAYSLHVFGDMSYDKSTVLFSSEQDKYVIDSRLKEAGIDPQNFVVVHMAVTWRNRTYPLDSWTKVLHGIVNSGRNVVIIGSGSDMIIRGNGIYDLTRKLTIQQISDLMSRSKCFVGNDSSMIHVAGTTNVPIVGIFTSAKGEYRVPYRDGEFGKKCFILHPQVECYGCLHEEKAPVVYCDCRRGDFICLSQITPEMVLDSVKRACDL